MNRFVRSALAAVAISTSFASQAVLITNPGDPALAGSTVIDFNGAATGNNTSYSFSGVTFSTTGGTLRIAPFGEGGSSWNGSGQTLTTRDTTVSNFSINFSQAVSAFGMDWGAANPNWRVDVFDASNELLGSEVFDGGTGGTGGSFREFYGVSVLGAISRAELTSLGGQDWVIVDNFQFVTASNDNRVPEPAGLALIGMALAAAAVARKRRA